jgi:hypothetical protein
VICMAKEESVIARALCQLLEADMIAQGMEPKLAKTLAGRACEVSVIRTGKAAKRGAKRVAKGTRKAAKGMSRAMKEANQKMRKANGQLKKGKTQADVARLAHKLRRKYI